MAPFADCHRMVVHDKMDIADEWTFTGQQIGSPLA